MAPTATLLRATKLNDWLWTHSGLQDTAVSVHPRHVQ